MSKPDLNVDPVDKAMLKNMSYEDVENFYNYIAEFSKELDSPELLADAAESLRLAIETRDLDLLEKCRKQIIMFALQEGDNSVFNCSAPFNIKSDRNINYLLD